MSRMDNENCGESVCSVHKESTHVEHDYCRAEVTCHTGEKKDHGLGRKFEEQAVEKWTDGPPVQVRNDDDRNKCKIPAVMGQFLRVLTPKNLSKGRKEASAETPHPAKAAEPEESSEAKSESLSKSEYETPSANVRNTVRNAVDDSGMISQESDLSESITPDFEFLRDVPTQPRPAQRLTPVCPSPACPQAFASSATRDTSIHSQPTQILIGGGELPDFRQAFGSMLPSNFSNSSSPPPSLTPHYPSSDTGEGVVDLGTQCDNPNNASPPSLTPNYLSSDSERTVRADTSHTSDADPELDAQHENSPPLFSTQNYPPSDNQETALADTSDTRRAVVDLGTRYENSNSVSPPSFFDASDTRQEVICTQYESSNSGDSMLAQSITSDLELSDIQRVMDRETRDENSNGSKVTRPAPTDLESGSTGSTASITKFSETRCGLDDEDFPTQNRSPFRQDVNENLVAKNKQTPKRKREEEPESLWTDEDYSQSGSPVLEIMSNHLGRLSRVAADPCAISIGTNLSAPGFFTAPLRHPESVNLDHSYSERTRKSSVFRTLELEGSKREEAVEIRTVGEFTGSDASNLRNFERRRVRKVEKRKIDLHESKENRPAGKRRARDETTRRSNFDSKESRANSKVPRECDRTGSIELSEGLLSNNCCEYDHIFLNVSSIDDLLYDPILLRHLVEPDYEAIKRKIDVLVTRIEALGEEL